jgi:hypothetical protein
MGSPFVVGFLLGTVFTAMLCGVVCYFYDRRRFEGDHARIVAIARHEAHQAARQKIEELMRHKAERPTKELKLPPEERPTRVHGAGEWPKAGG